MIWFEGSKTLAVAEESQGAQRRSGAARFNVGIYNGRESKQNPRLIRTHGWVILSSHQKQAHPTCPDPNRNKNVHKTLLEKQRPCKFLTLFRVTDHQFPMAARAGSSSAAQEDPFVENEEELIFGAESGWVEARNFCDHLPSLSSDLAHIPSPDTPCNRCQHPNENWLCLCCKDVLCSRFVNKHMLQHFQQTNHCLALSYSDLSVWCFSCDAYLDAQVIPQLRGVYETAYILKFGEAPPFRTI